MTMGRRRLAMVPPLQVFVMGVFIGFGLYVLLYYRPSQNGGNYIDHLDQSEMTAADIVYNAIANSYVWNPVVPRDRDPLYSKVKVLCFVIRSTYNIAYKLNINSTWGRECNTIVFVGTGQEDSNSNEDLNLVSILRRVYSQSSNTVDWFLVTSDKMFVHMQNLRHFLGSFPSSIPLQFGHAMVTHNNVTFISNAPGFVLSKEALQRVVTVRYDATKARSSSHGCNELLRLVSNDFKSLSRSSIFTSKCMKKLGIKLKDTRDSYGRLRFIPLPLQDLFINSEEDLKFHHVFSNALTPIELGMNCCSDGAILLTGTLRESRSILSTDYFVHHIRVATRTKSKSNEGLH